MTKLTVATPTTALVYLDRALKTIAPFGLAAPQTDAPIVGLVEELAVIDDAKALTIAKTLQQSSIFNEAVRTQISDMTIGKRYEKITENFDSIISDSKSLIVQIEENRNGFKEKIGRAWMKISRGSIHSRFEKSKRIYTEVAKEMKNQIEREGKILEAYLDYRGALKDSEIESAKIFKIQTDRLDTAKNVLAERNAAIEQTTDPEEKARRQLARDEAQRAFDKENRRYQLCKEISEQLTIAYNVGDTVIANLNQTRGIKQSVYDKAVIFFGANESVFTSLDANLTATAGLNEGTETVNAMTEGLNKGLETLAEVGAGVKMKALKTAYGTSVKAESVKKLIDSMVKFQSDSIVEIKRLREESAKEAEQIGKIVEDGKDRFTKLVTQ